MSDKHPEIIIIKRKGGHGDEHHGGAWKIAFADFMTAMMAFFMVLWIVNATDKSTKSVIARYFNPVRLEEPAKGKKGIHDDSGTASAELEDANASADSASNNAKSEENSKGSAGESAKDKEKDKDKEKEKEKEKEKDKEKEKEKEKEKSSHAEAPKPKAKEGAESSKSAEQSHAAAEAALFADPYAALERIAGPVAKTASNGAAEKSGSQKNVARTMNDMFRDPFEPIEEEEEQSESGSQSQMADNTPPEPQAQGASSQKKAAEQSSNSAPKQESAPKPAPPSSSSAAASSHPASPEQKLAAIASQVLSELNRKLHGTGAAAAGPSLDVKVTEEGLLVSLTDKIGFSMFPLGSAEPQREVVKVMNTIAEVLRKQPGTIVVRGFTDARPYHSQTYDNWRLSEARAQMAYYMLTRGALDPARVERVEGYADRKPKIPANPLAPENRRIEVLLREPKQ